MVIFRENTEDIYAGIEFRAGTPESQRFLKLFEKSFPRNYQNSIRDRKSDQRVCFAGAGTGKADVEVGIGLNR